MLVTYVLGACPGCRQENAFGNVDVRCDHVLRGCKYCRYAEHIPLPPVRKKILYLDQFFFSHAFRGGDNRFLEAAKRIERLAALQLLAVPYSSIHEDETHQWQGRDALFKFIKATSRGAEFEPAYDVDQEQLQKAFQAWLAGEPAQYVLEEEDALRGNLHEWDSYIRIEVGRYLGDIDLIRDLKRQSIEGLVDLFPGWRQSKATFEEDLQAEYSIAGKNYLESYLAFALRIVAGDVNALFDSPIVSTVVQSLLHGMPDDVPEEERLKKCAQFLLQSEHFKQAPYQWLSAHMYTALKTMVKAGAYTNRDKALKRLSGFFYDVKHIATYSPYCDAFLMDQPMAALVADPKVALERRYGVKVFSRNNWDAMLTWFDELEANMTSDHKAGLAAAYPFLR